MVTALAICEVVFRPNIHMVPVKNFEQQDIKALHCVLSRLVKNRTAWSIKFEAERVCVLFSVG